jgi:acetoin utilization protein AcuC
VGTCGTLVAWDDRFLEYDFGPGHPFTEVSRGLAVRLLESLDRRYLPGGEWRRSDLAPAPREAVERFHRPAYLDRLSGLDHARHRELLDQGDTPSFPGCWTASRRLVGGTLTALEVLTSGETTRAFNPGGGLHHAHPDRASGFCILNDLAIAIATVLGSAGSGQRVAYVDIDAHHGDGVMYGFFEDGRLLDIDFHQDGRTIFPGTGFAEEVGRGDGAGHKVNLALPPGTGDAGLGGLFDRVAVPLLREFRPRLIVLQCGVDGHAGDSLGATELAYSPAGYRHVVQGLSQVAIELGNVPVLATGGGGYTAEHVARVLAGVPYWLANAERPEGGLPDPWRRSFEAALHRSAPTTWAASADPEPWTSAQEDRLVAPLERALGRRFPRVG